MLTEKALSRHLKRWHSESSSLYRFNVYSVDDKDDLLNYLDSIEKTITPVMKEELEIAYNIVMD